MKRRQFLKSTLSVGVGWFMTQLIACDDSPSPDRGSELPPDPNVELPPLDAVKKGPYVQITGPNSARLRFETDIDGIYQVKIVCGTEIGVFEPVRSTEFVDYERRIDELFLDPTLTPDIAGELTLHSLELENVPPNTPIEFIVVPRDAEPIRGSFTMKRDQEFTVGWLADTMFPFAEDVIGLLAEQAPDLVIHGGDLTYDPSPFDSWNHVMRQLQPLFYQAPMHFVVGNHEFESQNEITAQFDRLMRGQGGPQHTARYFAFRYAHLYVVCIDSESANLDADASAELFDPESAQRRWLEEQLASANEDAEIREILVCFHRPIFSCAKRWKSDKAERDDLHGVFKRHNVRLVFCGHEHAYQRFDVDGIQYVVDGGGGALLNSPTEGVDELNALGRDEPSLQVAHEQSRGCTVLRFGADGAVRQQRFNDKGEITDSFELAARAG